MTRTLIAATWAACIAQASAGTLFVSLSGSNTPPYDAWSTASTSIQTAVNASFNGDTVLVSNGTYAITSEISVPYGITVRSVNGPEFTVVDAGAAARVFKLDHTNAVVEGFRIANGRVTGVGDHGGGALLLGGTLRDCEVIGNASINGLGGGVFVADQCLAMDCLVYSNHAPGAAFGRGGGVYCLNGTVERCDIRYNTAYLNGGGAMSEGGILRDCWVLYNSVTGSPAHGGGVYCTDTGSFPGHVENCTIINNQASRGGGLLIGLGEAVNNIVYFNTAPTDPDLGIVFAGDVSFSCAPGVVAGPGNFTNNPQLVNTSIGDARLRANSPCINAGTNTAGIELRLDADLQPRRFDGQVDVGADETVIAARALAGTEVVTSEWDTVFGAVCRLQSTTNLLSPAWTDVGPAQTANLARISFTDPTPSATHQAYRLLWTR